MLPAGKRASLMPQRCNSRQSNLVFPNPIGGVLMVLGASPARRRTATLTGLSAYIRDGDERTTDNSAAKIGIDVTEHGCLGDGVKAGQRRQLFVRDAGSIYRQQAKEDCGPWRKSRGARSAFRQTTSR